MTRGNVPVAPAGSRWGARAEDAASETARQGGAPALISPAMAPGGDPPLFTGRLCSARPVLAESGCARSGAIGARLRAHGMARARLPASAPCRRMDPVAGPVLGAVAVASVLDGISADRSTASAHSAALRGPSRAGPEPPPLALVTGPVNRVAPGCTFRAWARRC